MLTNLTVGSNRGWSDSICGPLRMRLLTSLFLILTSTIASAQDNFGPCACPNESVIAANLVICIGGVNCTINVFGCNQQAPLGGPYLPKVCNVSPGTQNRVTTIKKICFTGDCILPALPPAQLAKAVYEAIECTMDVCGTDPWNNITPVTPGAIYCWTMLFPKCVTFTGSPLCIEACAPVRCCAVERRFEINNLGQCVPASAPFLPRYACSDPNECDTECITVQCPEGPVCCP